MINKNEIRILNLFRKNIFLETSIRNIAKMLGSKSYQRIYDAVNSLKKNKILKIEKIGNVSLVSLELNNVSISYLSFLDEHERKVSVPNYEKIVSIKEISRYLIIITGSYAKNNFKKTSDLDLILVIPDNERAIDIQKFAENLFLLFRPKIHLYVFNNKDFLDMLLGKNENYGKEIYKNHIIIKNPHIYYEILKEAKENGFKG